MVLINYTCFSIHFNSNITIKDSNRIQFGIFVDFFVQPHFTDQGSGRYLLVIGGPNPTGDLTLQVDFRGPVALTAHRPHQHKTVAVGDQGLCAVMWPREVTHLHRYNQLNTASVGENVNWSFRTVLTSPELLGHWPALQTSGPRTGSKRRSRRLCRRSPASERVRSISPTPPARDTGNASSPSFPKTLLVFWFKILAVLYDLKLEPSYT